MEKIDIEKIYVSYGYLSGYDVAQGDGLEKRIKLLSEKINEIVDWINDKKDQLL